jgi:hypothetical protein
MMSKKFATATERLSAIGSKQFVPASRSDIKPGNRLKIRFNNERSKPDVYGRVTSDPVTMRRGDLRFQIDVGTEFPLAVRHGDYTGTDVYVEVDVQERVRKALAARKRSYWTPDPTVMVTLVGGPLEGATVPLTRCHTPWLTLQITCKGQTGHYRSGRWVPAPLDTVAG